MPAQLLPTKMTSRVFFDAPASATGPASGAHAANVTAATTACSTVGRRERLGPQAITGRNGTAVPARVATDNRRYGRASSTRLNGVSVARRNRVNPASSATARSRSSPAWAPRASPTSWSSEDGVQITVEAA